MNSKTESVKFKLNIKPGRVALYTILTIFAVMCFYPLVWLIINSLKTNRELFNNPWGLAVEFQWVNYLNA